MNNPFKKFKIWFIDVCEWFFDFKDWKMLLRSIPGVVTMLFIMATITMNLAANKIVWSGININGTPFVSITGGLFLSWAVFLVMDIITKTYGTKAAIKLTVLGALVNAIAVIFLALIALFPAKYPFPDASLHFDTLLGFEAKDAAPQPWQILISSTVAYIASGILNAIINGLFGKIFKNNPDGKVAFYCRSYVSTMIGQFVDNFIFAGLAFAIFAKIYTFSTLIGIALVGALLELVCEIVFSPVGYRICKRWQNEGVGKDYFDYCKEMELKKDPSRFEFKNEENV
ncbi:MAG: queuosine precursor transporter [Acholeplasmatales bacterium]|nr:queuosine precursor transporter [Acholeplasmatales bacterium]